MKLRSLSLCLLLVLAGCSKQSQTAQNDPAAPVIASVEQKVSYGIGYNMGAGLARDGRFAVDQAALTAGIKDGLAKANPRLPDAELEAAFVALQEKINAVHAAAGQKNLSAANEYLAKNKAKPGVTVTASGLQYEVLKSGTGPKPTPANTVRVHYHGTLIDGSVFDSSVQRNEPAEFEVTGVIPAWTEALLLMSVGDKWKLTIPPAIGYGAQEKDRIPPNSVLIFEVELLAIK